MRAVCSRAAVLAAAIAFVLAPRAGGDAPAEADRFDTVVIDAGHGGEDEGAKGSRSTWPSALRRGCASAGCAW